MQHEFLLRESRQVVDHLLVVTGAESHGTENLRLATREKAGTMRARKEGHFAIDLPDIRRRPSVDPLALAQNHFAAELVF